MTAPVLTLNGARANVARLHVPAGGRWLVDVELDGTDVTGGVVTVATGDAIGDKKAGTAITAANEFAEGALLDVEFVVGTQMTAGRFDLFVTVAPTIGL